MFFQKNKNKKKQNNVSAKSKLQNVVLKYWWRWVFTLFKKICYEQVLELLFIYLFLAAISCQRLAYVCRKINRIPWFRWYCIIKSLRKLKLIRQGCQSLGKRAHAKDGNTQNTFCRWCSIILMTKAYVGRIVNLGGTNTRWKKQHIWILSVKVVCVLLFLLGKLI